MERYQHARALAFADDGYIHSELKDCLLILAELKHGFIEDCGIRRRLGMPSRAQRQVNLATPSFNQMCPTGRRSTASHRSGGSISVVALDRPTRGAAQSVLQAHLIDNESPLAIFDCNHRLLWSSGCSGLSSLVGCLATHRDLAHDTPLPEREAHERAGAADAIVTVFRD